MKDNVKNILESDPNIATALAAARGRTPLDRGSLSERLAALSGDGGKAKLIEAA